MSTTPRPPLLSDDALVELTYVKEDGRRPSEQVRDFYEDLITTGKLRVMEEVEFKGNDYDCILQCTSCNWGIGWHIKEDLEPMKFCPGCGNKIKP